MIQPLPSFLLVTDGQRKPDPLTDIVGLAAGDGVIFRHYDHPERAALAGSVSHLTRQRRVCLLVAADWRLAAQVGAAGVHLPEGLLRSGLVAPMLGWARRHHRLVTAACHSRMALGAARRLRIDGGVVSPVQATASHPDVRPLGLLRFSTLCRSACIPVLALGGVRRDLRRRSGAWGMAATIPLNPKRHTGTNRA